MANFLDALFAQTSSTAALQTTGADVNVSEASPPIAGKALVAVDAEHAEWSSSGIAVDDIARDAAADAQDTADAALTAAGDAQADADAAQATADAAVPKSTYDANTILIADSDNTPIALAVAASRVVLRKSTGGIIAGTGAEAREVLSLDNVTNDAQVKAAIAGYSAKSPLVVADLAYIGDSAASNAIKKATLADIIALSTWGVHTRPPSPNAEDDEFDGAVGSAPSGSYKAWYTPVTAESSYTSIASPTTGVDGTANNSTSDTAIEWQQGYRPSCLTVKPKRITLNAGGAGATNRTVISKTLGSALPVSGSTPWFVYTRVCVQLNNSNHTSGGDAFDEGYFFFSLARDSSGAPDPANRLQIRVLRQVWPSSGGNPQIVWTKKVGGSETTVTTRFFAPTNGGDHSIGTAAIDGVGIGYNGTDFYAAFLHGENWELLYKTSASFGGTLQHAHWSMYATGSTSDSPMPTLFHIDYLRRRTCPN